MPLPHPKTQSSSAFSTSDRILFLYSFENALTSEYAYISEQLLLDISRMMSAGYTNLYSRPTEKHIAGYLLKVSDVTTKRTKEDSFRTINQASMHPFRSPFYWKMKYQD